mmetsp:Transcript_53150/g.99644  ORF Transcript_53150/g.99644 Transcript_53150/m.99644 type:complete len:520 (+) Transcript_53150:93-1652(+)
MLRTALALTALGVARSEGCLGNGDASCLASAEDAAASWVQMAVRSEAKSSGGVLVKAADEEGHFYSTRGGDGTRSNTFDWSVPMDFSKPAWVWKNKDDEQIRHSPLIDNEHNIYLSSTFKLRKYSKSGDLLWTFHSDEQCNTSPAIGKGRIFFRCAQNRPYQRVYGLSMDTGAILFNTTIPFKYGQDSQSVLLSGDHLIVPAVVKAQDGSDTVVAMNASSGDKLWHYTTDEIMWNFSPSTPGDGTLLFSSTCGHVFRLSLEGNLLWEAGPGHPTASGQCSSTGGGTLGPNGMFYVAHAQPQTDKPLGFMSSDHFLAAFNITNGNEVWRVKLDQPYGANQYMAVGYLSEGGPIAAVAAIGQNALLSPPMSADDLATYQSSPEVRKEMGVPTYVNAVLALDAATGEQLWRWDEPAWDHYAAAGDEVEYGTMASRAVRGEGAICLPDNQGIPLINTKDGTVIVSSAHNGNLTTIRDVNQNGKIEPEEVSAFAPHIGFLNSPSVAPGMLIAAPCWGDVYVFTE